MYVPLSALTAGMGIFTLIAARYFVITFPTPPLFSDLLELCGARMGGGCALSAVCVGFFLCRF